MPLVESKRFWVKPLTINAAVNFIIYEAAFYALYWSNPEMASTSAWRFLLLISLAVGAFVACLPALSRYENDEIRIHGKRNLTLYVPIISVCIFTVFYAFYSFVNWSPFFNPYFLSSFCFFYLFSVPVVGFAMFKLLYDK